jgi:hypothetical protein
MTEAEWLTCADPDKMRAALYDPVLVSYRKLRLYACACCRLIPGFMDSASDRDSVTFAEREADGCADADEDFPDGEASDIRWYRRDEWNSAARAVGHYKEALWVTHQLHDKPEDERAAIYRNGDRILSDLLREVLGNPIRPVLMKPDWLTATVVAIASQMYESRDFSAMPILADALQDAGCDNTDILDHCRHQGEHVLGCWVVDLVLGKP